MPIKQILILKLIDCYECHLFENEITEIKVIKTITNTSYINYMNTGH